MISTRWGLPLALCALSATAGCGGASAPTIPNDSGNSVDGAATDNGAPTDSGAPTDTGTPSDNGAPTDSGTPTDTVEPVDAPAPTDGATPLDVVDAGEADAGLDVPTPSDVPAVDAPAPADAGADVPAADVQPDVAVDGGPACPASRETITLPSATAVSIMGSTASAGVSVIPSTRCQTNTGGAEAIYTLVVTTRLGVILSTDNAGTNFDTTLSIRRSCMDPASELSCDDDSGIGSGRVATSVLRVVLEPGTYTVIVDGFSSGSGNFVLTAGTFTPADNATCATARALTVGTPVTGLTLANAGGPGFCAPGLTPGGQTFFSVNVPANSRGVVRYTRPAGSWSASLRAVDSCAATTCTGVDTFSGAGTFFLSNSTAAARTMVFSVAATSSEATATPFDLAVSTTPAVAGQVCAEPVVVAPGATVTGQNAAAGVVASTACNATAANGGQLFYRVTVPAQSRAQVRAVPAGAMTAWTPTLRALGSCSVTLCADSSTAAAAGGTAAVTLTNYLEVARDYLVSVSGSAAASGTFNLEVGAATLLPGYTNATITAACDDLSSGTVVTTSAGGSWSDDSASAVAALPFTASFFGQPVARWAVTSNGLLQLFPETGTATVSTEYSNSSLPSVSAPNGFLAAFWDDLLTVTGTGVRTATLGTMPARRFVVQWTDFNVGGSDVRLTMQAKVFEGSNALEIHYCSVMPASNTRASGNSATIGAESLAGEFAAQVSYDTASAAVTGRAYRLTPR